MSVVYKNKQGELKKIAGYLTQKVNARWFLCTRREEDGQEYYDVPEDQTKDYFANISPYTVYSFGFDEPNTTATPKLRFKGQVYDIMDLTGLEPEQLGIGQLKGVYQMFTQESEGDKTIYFIGDMHQDYDNITSTYGRQVQLGLLGVIEAGRIVFTVQDPETFIQYRTNLHKFFLAAHLPVVVPTFQSLDRTLKVAIEFGDTVYNMYNYMLGADTPLTIGDLMSTASYDPNVGFYFNFEATFFENSDLVGFAVIPPAIIALQLDDIIEDTDTVVSDISEDGTRLSIHLSASVVSKLARTLVTPMSPPATEQLVGISKTGTQMQFGLGDGLEVENGTVKLTSAGPFVSYTDEQTLTEEQKAQARANIGASAGSDQFDGKYTTLTEKPIMDTSSTISLTPVENETINGTIKLHKVSKTGAAKDLNVDDQHNFITSAEKQQIATNAQNITDLDADIATLESEKFDKAGGTVTGDTIFTQKVTVQDFIASSIKAMIANATEQQPFVVVMDNAGNATKRAINDLINDAGGSVVTVGGERQAIFEMNTKANQSALDAEVTARTNALVNVNTHLSTIDDQIVALNGAINTEAETRETEIENVQSALNTETTNRTTADTALSNRINNDATPHTTRALTLTVAGWSNKTQGITISGYNSAKLNTVVVDPASAIAWANAGVNATAESSTGITFTCSVVPTVALKFRVVSETVIS